MSDVITYDYKYDCLIAYTMSNDVTTEANQLYKINKYKISHDSNMKRGFRIFTSKSPKGITITEEDVTKQISKNRIYVIVLQKCSIKYDDNGDVAGIKEHINEEIVYWATKNSWNKFIEENVTKDRSVTILSGIYWTQDNTGKFRIPNIT